MANSQELEPTPNCPACHYHYVPPPSHHHHHSPNPNPNPNPNPIPPPVAAPPPQPVMAANPYAPHGGYVLPQPQVGPTPAPYYYGGAGAGAGDVSMVRPSHGVNPALVGYANPRPPRTLMVYAPVPPRPAKGLGTLASPSAFLGTPPCSCAKSSKKATKVVQSAYCEVCNVNCTCQEDLNNHKQGKKHKKNLEKLQESITPKTEEPVAKEAAAAGKGKAVVADEQKKRKEAPAAAEELESKKKRVLESGAAPDGLRVCTICNVVANSQTVYDSHIVGQKHAAMVKKQQAAAVS